MPSWKNCRLEFAKNLLPEERIAIEKYNKTFTYQNVGTVKVASIIKKSNSKKASKSDVITAKVIKELGTFFAEFLSKNFNSCLETGSFPDGLRFAEVVPIYKKNDKEIKVTIDL